MGTKLATVSQKPQKHAFCKCPVKRVRSLYQGSVSALGGTGTWRCHQKKIPVGGVQLWAHRYHLELPQGKSPSGSCPG